MNRIIFAGLAKNCIDSVSKNIYFIENFQENYPKLEISFYILESDSSDGTKEFLKNIESKIVKSSSQDNLKNRFKYRTDRIAHCRNILLEEIKKKHLSEDFLYIPIDLDIEIFKYTDEDSFYKILMDFINHTSIDVLFPFGYPYYYDIHALRAADWNMENPWEVVKNINKYLVIGKIIPRYLFVYSKQKKYKEKKKLINVESAFGGIGIYKVYNNKLKDIRYSIDMKLGNNSCEHTAFNSYFNNKFIDCSWKIPSPKEHIIFKELNFFQKIIFVVRSVLSDFKNIKSKLFF